MRFEHRTEPLLPPREFYGRLAWSLLAACGVVTVSLLLGMAGYHWIARLAWVDAFENSAMILTGMGPVDPMPTPGAKLFAGVFALYSGLVVLTVAGLVLGPPLHRVMHHFHLETDEVSSKRRS
jgi:hypothetical protein